MKRYLECPNCSEGIQLTWKRYFISVSNRYWCPSCGQASQFATKPAWIQFASWAIQFMVVMLPFLLDDIWPLILLVSGVAVVFVIDKKLDEKFGILIDESKEQSTSEQNVADQPAAATESKAEGNEKTKLESEGRSQ